MKYKEMTQEQKQLLLKDLSARLPYGVNVEIKGSYDDGEGYIRTSELDYTMLGYMYDDESSIIPYLRPMSSMTKEEKEDFGVPFTSEGLVTLSDTVECMDWLIAHHFDFRGLIEKGLALEAPEGIYDR